MANQYDRGMDDYFSGRDLPKDPTIEYLQGYSHAESLYDQPNFQEQVDDRFQEYNEEKYRKYLEENENNTPMMPYDNPAEF